jgi:hypothetical protein
MPEETSTSNSGNFEVTQTALQVGGDNAARDVNKISIVTSASLDGNPAKAFIARLTEQYRKEKENNVRFRETVERLQHYQTQADGGLVLTLEEKLQQGGREDLIRFALATKEMFTKKLVKYSLYESAQEIQAFLLAEVYSRFHEFVYQDVCDKKPADVVNARIRVQIIEPLLGMLGENILKHYAEDINGMLYFLTGNCHIKWTQ